MQLTQPPIREVEYITDKDTRFAVTTDHTGITLDQVSADNTLISINGWSSWTAYTGFEQLNHLKRAGDPIPSGSVLTAYRRDRDEDEDLWWMPDEYISGI